MKTIEERATEYACDGCMPDGGECDSCYNIHGKCERDAYIAGAKTEREEMTRWNDPKEEIPTDSQRILIKATCGHREYVCLGSLIEGLWEADGGMVLTHDARHVLGFDGLVIGWREIHE